MKDKEIADAWLKFLADRFRSKIDPKDYILSYSGGKDSHFLYWFIKEWLKWDEIEIVGVNTSFELPEIRDRIIKNSDVVLFPEKSRKELKETYGIPCYNKQTDEYIYRYQNGSRSENTMKAIMGYGNTLFVIKQQARELLLSDKLHKVSNKCCLYNKEYPLKHYCKKHNKKSIIGVRGGESKTRKAKYTTCLQKSGNFTPLYDFSDELMDLIYDVYGLEVPKCYNYLERTGCAGCPYGYHCEDELSLLSDAQRKHTIEFFKESYDVKGINYNDIQLTLDLMKGEKQ